ncbi:MAG: 1-acyl-sn-glycerol-3-phosphate acyltransferase [Ruminococcaceae bacterium]|nr:1-acyl-sn-glycerol-3-phosphate acyltransferase [Oscillospiraceae bacterium]
MPRKKRKKNQWVKWRHKPVRLILAGFVGAYVRIKSGVKVEKLKNSNKRQYLIIMNHTTAFDQFFIGMAFKQPVYYIASEDLFSNGFVSKLLSYFLAPIPIKKQTTDIKAVRDCLRVAKEGGTIALAPEGNRSFSGKTGYFKPSIASLAARLKLPIAVFRIEGGYGAHPRWSDVWRKGYLRAYVSRVIEPEEYKQLSEDELFRLIQKEMYVDEAVADHTYHHEKLAEYIERAMYVCPYCGLSEFESHNDVVQCRKCGRKIRYLPTKELQGIDFEFPFRFMSDWYDYQCSFINSLDLMAFGDEPIYSDTTQFSEVILYKNKRLICKEARMSIYNDKITADIGSEIIMLPFDEISVITVLGRNKLNIYHKDKLYQLKGEKRFNALKYMNLYYRKKNMEMGDNDGQFLGL